MRLNKRQVLFLISAAIAAATLVAYEPIRHNGFVGYDDDKYITENPNLSGGITLQSFIWAFTKSYSANWHPLTWLSHMLDCEIYGLNPLGHHITNVILHIANSLLLFLLLSKMTGTIWPGVFVAAVFALHPVHVESVAWVAERKDVLSTLFWMLTMLAYVRYAERPNFKRYSIVLLAFAMGLMSKPMVVTLPFVLLLLDYWPLGRFLNSKFSILNLLLEKIPLFVLSAFSCVMTLIAQHSGGAVATLEKIPLDYRIANMFVSYISYIGKMIWPNRLAIFYPHPRTNFSDTTTIICTLLFFLITATGIYICRRKRYAAVGWLWYVGTLVPVIGLVQVGLQAMADRYMYIPMLGLLIIVAWAVKDLVANRPRWKTVAAVLTTVVLSILLILTRMQVRHWQNNITLFEYALNVTENNALAENNYGCALFKAERQDEAVLHLSNALRIDPKYSNARNNLAKVFLKQGKFDEAIECLNELIKSDQGSAEVAGAYSMQKKEALRINPNQAEIYANLGTAYIQLGKYGQAIENWTRTVELNPNNANALNSLAWTMATVNETTIQDTNKAVEYALRACELTGYNDPEFLDTLAAAYAASGRFDDAVKAAEQVIDMLKAEGRKDLVSEIQNRIKLYRAGQRYHQK